MKAKRKRSNSTPTLPLRPIPPEILPPTIYIPMSHMGHPDANGAGVVWLEDRICSGMSHMRHADVNRGALEGSFCNGMSHMRHGIAHGQCEAEGGQVIQAKHAMDSTEFAAEPRILT